MWKEKLNAKVIELKNHGHYTEGGMGTTEFPELLKEILEIQNSEIHSKFKIQNSKLEIEVFTTRPDTLFGASYLVLAPEHEILKQVQDDNVLGIRNIDEVKAYLEQTKNKTEMERLESKE
ncbi:MAG TPA: hypothetical protein ENL06_02580, partial [Candidatus Portnoybacteria bacterium]|nr:hypothetical protein [Candidatus Portnoybacteria bacterium]